MATTVQQRPLTNRPSSWTDSVTFDQIDPASGATSATLTLGSTLTSVASVVSLERAASTFSSTDAATVSLGAGTLTNTPKTTVTASLAAFDGSSLPVTTLPATASDTATVTYVAGGTPDPAASAFFGTGTVTLPVVATARISATGPGNLAAVFASDIAATATLAVTTGGKPGDGLGSVIGVITGGGGGLGSIVIDNGLTQVQTVILARNTTGWTAPVTVNGFNPQLGRLTSVEYQLNVNSTGSFGVENEDPVATTANLRQDATVTLNDAAGHSLDSATADIASNRTLQAFDGVADNAGPSGATATDLAATATGSNAISDAPGLAAYDTVAPITLQAVSTGRTTIDGPGNLAVGTSLQAGATVTVTYHYTAATDPLFDRAAYLAQNRDVAAAGIDPYAHFLAYGAAEGRNPDALFDVKYYLAHNPDVAAAHVNPLLHYEAFGWHEGRDPSAAFSTTKYLAAYPDVRAAGVDPLVHYLMSGQSEGRLAFGS